MAISNYGELKTAIYTWMNRDDLTAIAPDFVTLAQERIWTDMVKAGASRFLEDSTTDTTSGTIAFPAELVSIRSLKINANGIWHPLEPIEPNIAQTISAVPNSYYVQAQSAILSPPPDGTYSYLMRYVKKLAAFSADSDSDSILTTHPSVYLYACLLEAQPYQDDWTKAQAWNQAYQDALNRLVGVDKNKFGMMVVRPDKVGR